MASKNWMPSPPSGHEGASVYSRADDEPVLAGQVFLSAVGLATTLMGACGVSVDQCMNLLNGTGHVMFMAGPAHALRYLQSVASTSMYAVRNEKPLNILSFDDIRFTNICAAIQNEKEAKKSKSTKSNNKSGSWSGSQQKGKQQHKKDWKRNDKKEDDNSQ